MEGTGGEYCGVQKILKIDPGGLAQILSEIYSENNYEKWSTFAEDIEK